MSSLPSTSSSSTSSSLLTLIDLVNRLRNNDTIALWEKPIYRKTPLDYYSLAAGNDINDNVITEFVTNFPNTTCPYMIHFEGPWSSAITIAGIQTFLYHIIIGQQTTKRFGFCNNCLDLETTRILANLFRQSYRTNTTSSSILIKLDLSNNSTIPIEGIVDLLESLQQNPTLEELNLRSSIPCSTASESERHLLGQALRNFLHANSTVQFLVLPNNNICDIVATELAIGLRTNKSLMDLWLCDNNIRNEGVIAIAESIRYNNNNRLRVINLQGNTNIGDNGIVAISESFRLYKTSLESFYISVDNVSDSVLSVFANSIKYNTSLLHVSIQSNNTSGRFNDGMCTIPFLEALQYNTTILTLEMDIFYIGDEAVVPVNTNLLRQKFNEMLQYNNTLTNIVTIPLPTSDQKTLLMENKNKNRIAPKKGGRIRTDAYCWLIKSLDLF